MPSAADPRPAVRKEEWTLKDFRQELYENGYFRQEEFGFADCDRYQRPGSPVF